MPGAGRDHGPDAFAPPPPRLAARAHRDVPINHHKADRLLREIVRRLRSWRCDECEKRLAMLAKTLRHVLSPTGGRYIVETRVQHTITCACQFSVERGRR